MFDYIKDKYFNYKKINKYGLSIVLIDGYIYRGDIHKNKLATEKPKFFGSYYSSTQYITNDISYIKKYSTTKELNLLNITSDSVNKFFDHPNTVTEILKYYKDTNETKIHNMFKNIKILINITFGTCDTILIDDEFITFLKNIDIEEKTIKFINFIIKVTNSKKYIPSRISIRSIEKPLMILLKYIFLPFNIDGLICNNIYTQKSICHMVNKLYKNNKVNTCVPTEICIFNPKKSLKFIKFVN